MTRSIQEREERKNGRLEGGKLGGSKGKRVGSREKGQP